MGSQNCLMSTAGVSQACDSSLALPTCFVPEPAKPRLLRAHDPLPWVPPSAWTLGRTHASRARCARSSRDPPGWPDRGHVAASGPAPQPCDWASSHTFPNHVGLPSAPAPPLACLRGQGQAGRPPLRRARRWLLRAVAVGAGTHLALLHECGSGRARARGCSPQKLSHRHLL